MKLIGRSNGKKHSGIFAFLICKHSRFRNCHFTISALVRLCLHLLDSTVFMFIFLRGSSSHFITGIFYERPTFNVKPLSGISVSSVFLSWVFLSLSLPLLSCFLYWYAGTTFFNINRWVSMIQMLRKDTIFKMSFILFFYCLQLH